MRRVVEKDVLAQSIDEEVAKDGVIALPKTMALMTLASRIGVSLDDVLKTYLQVNGKEVGYARTQISYATAKQIAGLLGKETKKILFPRHHESKNYVFGDLRGQDVRHEWAEFNPAFAALDTTKYAIHYLRGLEGKGQQGELFDREVVQKEIPLHQLYPTKKGVTISKKKADEQRNAHIAHMSQRLGVTPEEFLSTMRKGFSKIQFEGEFDAIDPSDVLQYIIEGASDKDRYPETYEMLHKRYGEDTELMIYILSATSIRSTLESNVAKALDIFEIFNVEEEEEFINFMDGANFMDGIYIQLKKIKASMNDQKQFVDGHPLSGRKVISFSNGMLGDKNVVVVDRRLQRAFKIDRNTSPSNKEYDQVENLVRIIARAIGREPRQVSAAIRCSIRRKYFKDQKDYGVALLQQEHKRANRKIQKEYIASISTLFSEESFVEAE